MLTGIFSRIFAYALIQNTGNKTINQSEATQPSTNNLVTSTQQVQLENIAIFPIPTQDNLQIELPDDTTTQLELFDALGRVVLQQEIISSASLSLSDLPSGQYYLRLQNKKGKLIKPIIKN